MRATKARYISIRMLFCNEGTTKKPCYNANHLDFHAVATEFLNFRCIPSPPPCTPVATLREHAAVTDSQVIRQFFV